MLCFLPLQRAQRLRKRRHEKISTPLKHKFLIAHVNNFSFYKVFWLFKVNDVWSFVCIHNDPEKTTLKRYFLPCGQTTFSIVLINFIETWVKWVHTYANWQLKNKDKTFFCKCVYHFQHQHRLLLLSSRI